MSWSKKLLPRLFQYYFLIRKTPYINVRIKEHHLVSMPTCVTRWWTLWNIFGQITLHCSNHLVDEHDHLYCSTTLPYLIFSKFKHTFCFVFLVMPLPLPLPLPVGTVLELPLPGPVKVVNWRCLRLKFSGTWSCRRQSSGPSWSGQ